MRCARGPDPARCAPAPTGTLATMLIFLAAVAGASVWIVLWALGVNPFDGLMVFILFLLVAAGVHVISPFLPGNRGDPDEPGGSGGGIAR